MSAFSIQGHVFTDSGRLLSNWSDQAIPAAAPWEQEYLRFLSQWGAGQEEWVFQSSGTTGARSSVRFTRSQIEASAHLTARVFDLSRGAKALLCLPGQYIAGKMMLARAVVNGWDLHWEEPSSLPFGGQLPKADILSVTPMQLANLLQFSSRSLDPLRIVLVGGAPVSPALREACRGLSSRIVETYGMMETLSHAALRELSGSRASDWFYPIPPITVAADSRGCLVIHAKHLGNVQVITNDVADWNGQGGFRIVGRADFLINSGGVKVFPERVEEKIGHLLSAPFYITWKSDEGLGQKVVLCVEGEELSDARKQDLLSRIAECLSAHERPREVYCLREFSRTLSGKIIRKPAN
ncbi:MAG: AMP-binding protein [Flavobacteriales bacterium]|jgi:O-succinylbenzoic acid--CoA ligase